VHYVNRDSLGLANDFHSLGFVPEGTDLHAVASALRVAFDDGRRQSNDFQVINVLHSIIVNENLYCMMQHQNKWMQAS
jgi:aarF domain-containing kinase